MMIIQLWVILVHSCHWLIMLIIILIIIQVSDLLINWWRRQQHQLQQGQKEVPPTHTHTHTHTLPHYFYHNTIDFKESEKRRRLPRWYGKFRTKTMIIQIIRPRVHSNTVRYKRRYRKMFPSAFDYCTCIHIKINYNCRQGIIENILNILLFISTSHCRRIMQLLLITFYFVRSLHNKSLLFLELPQTGSFWAWSIETL